MHRKGFHCGSTAMGDALRHKGLDLPEPLLFGLGAGLGFSLHDGDLRLSPPQASRFFVGRSAWFERDLCKALGVTLHEGYYGEPAQAWRHVEELLRHGELPLVYTDLRELPYLGAHGHWFGHLIAVASPEAVVWDNERAEPQRVDPDQLIRALCTASPAGGHGCTVMHISRTPRRPASVRPSIALQAQRMGQGLAALRQFAQELPALRKRPDWQRIERVCAQTVQARGSGGGLFRPMYAQFLAEEGFAELAMLCTEAAQAWSALARGVDQERALACAEAEAALWRKAAELCA